MNTFFFKIHDRSFFISNKKTIISMIFNKCSKIPNDFTLNAFNVETYEKRSIKLILCKTDTDKKIVFKKKTKGSRPILTSSKEIIAQYKVEL